MRFDSSSHHFQSPVTTNCPLMPLSGESTRSPGHERLFILCLLIVFSYCFASTAVADSRVVYIPDGDFTSLQDVLCDASLGDEDRTVIHLAERGYYTPTRRADNRPSRWIACQYGGMTGNIPLSAGAGTILSNVVIKGNNATLDFEGQTGLSVAGGARLRLEAVEIRNTRWALAVDGHADLERVSVVYSQPEFPEQRAPIHNRGELVMRNSVVAANRLLHVPSELLVFSSSLDTCPDTASAGILNEGTLVANNVTLTHNDWESIELPVQPTGNCVTRDLTNMPGSEAWIGNSMLTSGLFANCAGTVQSRGYNSVPEGGACGFLGQGDTVVMEDGVYPFVPHEEVRQMGRQLFLPDSERLQAGSPEAIGESASACETLDVRGHTRGVVSDRCDRGAMDLSAAPALDSGLDGLWVDLDNDGQYLQVSHFGHGRVLLTWLGIGATGEPFWVYGSALRTGGNRVQTKAYENAGVRLVNGVLEGDVEADLWGELTVETLSCDQLHFRFDSLNPSLGTGDYVLTRLTDNPVADCSD
ncbi:MAG: hypothetical protein PVJ33_15310 [Lysobacterales bacterium]